MDLNYHDNVKAVTVTFSIHDKSLIDAYTFRAPGKVVSADVEIRFTDYVGFRHILEKKFQEFYSTVSTVMTDSMYYYMTYETPFGASYEATAPWNNPLELLNSGRFVRVPD